MTVSDNFNIGELDYPSTNFEFMLYNRLKKTKCIIGNYSVEGAQTSLMYKELNNHIINTFLKRHLELDLEMYQIKVIYPGRHETPVLNTRGHKLFSTYIIGEKDFNHPELEVFHLMYSLEVYKYTHYDKQEESNIRGNCSCSLL